jgi:hypothetical protein
MACMVPQPFYTRGNQPYPEFWTITSDPQYQGYFTMTYIFTQPGMNVRQWRWLELIKDFELEVLYHPGKVNVVADVLCRKAHYS